MQSRHVSHTLGLTKYTRLRLAEAVHMELRGSWLRLDTGGVSLELPRSMLPILAFFEEARTVEEGWRLLGVAAKGTQGVADAFAGIWALVDAGILVTEGGRIAPRNESIENSFGPAAQIRMLEDRHRTTRYLKAIRSSVQPGDVVVDVGTGTGILALAAAKAGAARVYAIESQPIADVAQRLFNESCFGNRITLLRGLSTELALPEKADVLVSEIIGNDPFGERIWETTRDAVSRLLKPGARLIPSRLRIFATPVDVPKTTRMQNFFTPDTLDRWERWYGLPFLGLLKEEGDIGDLLQRTYVNPWDARAWPVLGKPVLLNDFPLASPPASLTSEASLRFARSGPLGGLLVHFEADLAEAVTLSTEASRVNRRNHWKSLLWLFQAPRRVSRGDAIPLRSEVRNGRMNIALGEPST